MISILPRKTLLRNALCDIDPALASENETQPAKTSTYVFLRQATHKLAEFGTIGVPEFHIVTIEGQWTRDTYHNQRKERDVQQDLAQTP